MAFELANQLITSSCKDIHLMKFIFAKVSSPALYLFNVLLCYLGGFVLFLVIASAFFGNLYCLFVTIIVIFAKVSSPALYLFSVLLRYLSEFVLLTFIVFSLRLLFSIQHCPF